MMSLESIMKDMKKYIKLLSIFIAIVVAVVGALFAIEYFDEGFSSATESQRNSYAILSSKTESGWYDKNNWDNNLYDSQMKDIDNAYRLGEITARQRESLKDLVNTSAMFRLKTIMEAEMKSPNSRENVVATATGGLKVIRDYTNKKGDKPFKDDSRLVRLLNMSDAYKSVMAFTRSSFSIATDVNTSSYSWKSYVPKENQLKSARDNHRKSPYYDDYFSKITVVKNMMDSFDDKLSKAKFSHYEDVYKTLSATFKSDSDRLFRDIENEITQGDRYISYLNLSGSSADRNNLQTLVGNAQNLVMRSDDLLNKMRSARRQLDSEYPNNNFAFAQEYTDSQKRKLKSLTDNKSVLEHYLQ